MIIPFGLRLSRQATNAVATKQCGLSENSHNESEWESAAFL